MNLLSSFVDVVRKRAEADPERVLFSVLREGHRTPETLTAAALDQQAQAVAGTLEAMGAQGRTVLLLFPTGLDFLSAFFGCLYAGALAIPAPLPEASRLARTMPRLLGILADAQPLLVMCSDADLPLMHTLRQEYPAFHGLTALTVSQCLEQSARPWHPLPLKPESPAYLQYTSGSTALPRGNLLNHQNLLMCSGFIQQAKRYTRDSVAVVWVPAYHDDGLVHGILQPIFTGSRNVLMASTDFVARPQRWLEAISAYRATHSGGPNFAYDLCTRRVPEALLPTLDLSSWTLAYNAAEPIRAETLHQFHARFQACGFRWQSFAPCYGLAEATLTVSASGDGRGPTLLPVDARHLALTGRIQTVPAEAPGARVWVGCGVPVGSLDVQLVRPETLERCDANEVGEILVHGPTITQGYIGRPEETARTFQALLADGAGPYLRTGDLGFLHQGELFVTGRVKELIIVFGRNLYAHDLELAVEQVDPAIRGGCVVAFALEVDGAEALGVVAELDPARLQGRAPESLLEPIRLAVASAFEVQVQRLALVGPRGILKTSSGKLQRKQTGAALVAGELKPLCEWQAELAPESQSKTQSEPSAPPPVADLPQNRRADPALEARLWSLLRTLPGLRLPDWPEPDVALKSFGLDSVTAVAASALISDTLGRPLASTLLFDHPTLRRLAFFLQATAPALGAQEPSHGREGAAPDLAPTTSGTSPSTALTDPIVIVSMACRLPGDLTSPEAFWQFLVGEGDAIGPLPSDRGWPLAELLDPNPAAVGKTYVTGGGFLKDIAHFDAPFFKLSPSEAVGIDPQHRLLLTLTWEVLERAGIDPNAVEGRNIGVYVGLCSQDYATLLPPLEQTEDGSALIGCAPAVASGRIAYTFGLEGPALTLDTACSSSLVALHHACRALEGHECELAIVGGVTLFPTPGPFVAFSRLRALSPDGRCKAFSSQADGFGLSEGAGLVLVTRLSVAERQQLPVLAVVRGSAVNQDGRSQGLTAPNGLSQQRVIQAALARSGLQPSQIAVLEAHGTGTRLGDPIELQAILATYGAARATHKPSGGEPATSSVPPLWLGSVKSNLGHTQAAAGIVGVIKGVKALQHGQVPATLHSRGLTSHVDWSDGQLQPVQRLTDWPRGSEPRRMAISSFGISGTNAHLILEEAPRLTPPLPQTTSEPGQVSSHALPLLLSARTEADLRLLAGCYAEWLTTHPHQPWGSLVRTAAISRAGLPVRASLAADSVPEAIPVLQALAEGQSHPALTVDRARPRDRIAFVYPGQGSQWVGMGKALLAEDPAFAAAIDACDHALKPHTGWSLRALLEDDEQLSTRAEVIQPLLFAMAYALTQSWRALGVEPCAVVGHSQGEVVAAVVAGALSLETGARLSALRGKHLMSLSGRGALLAVLAPPAALEPRLVGQPLWISVVNGPDYTVVGGETAAVLSLAESLERTGISCRRVDADYASHTPLVEPVLPELEGALADLQTGTPHRTMAPPMISTMISTVTGRAIDGRDLTARYWCDNLRQPMRFDLALKTLLEQGITTFVEVSAHPILSQAISQRVAPAPLSAPGSGSAAEGVTPDDIPRTAPPVRVQATLRRQEGGRRRLLRSLAELSVKGVAVDWAQRLNWEPVAIALPTYPFQGERCWPQPLSHPSVQNPTTPQPLAAPAQRPTPSSHQEMTMIPPKSTRLQRVLDVIRQELPWLSDEHFDVNKSLPALGIESLKIMALQSALQRKLGIMLPNALFFDSRSSLHSLAEHGARQLPPEPEASPAPALAPAQAPAPAPVSTAASMTAPASLPLAAGEVQSLAQLMAAQLQAMSELTARQLETLQRMGVTGTPVMAPAHASVNMPVTALGGAPIGTVSARPAPATPAQHAPAPSSAPASSAPTSSASARPVFVPYKSLAERAATAPTHAQDYLGELVEEFCAFTPTSKARTQQDRFVFANNRNIAGLTPVVKEMSYQVIAERAHGAYFEDLDGNTFIDLTMSFGACLLGHGHPALTEALQAQLARIWSVGPISPHSGEVARRVAAMTGVERVAFFNSGTEAVMVAMRLARTVTGRPKIALFSGSYHGMVEGVLATANPDATQGESNPMSPGVPESQVQDTLVLRYDDPASLAILEARAHDIAGVLVEPVQARRLDLQPRRFLHALRELTQRLGIALIFDEMITGFRVMPGGAQAWFDVRADLVAYGKVLGGGMPIGVVAGTARFMDAIDGGGSWRFGDDSFPMATNTFVAGTFCSHPLAMACSVALLKRLEAEGPALQRTLTARTRHLVAQLNNILADEDLPIQVTQFASLFRFEMPPEYALLYHRLVSRGIYVWELRGCALSTAHSDADLQKVVETVRETAQWLARTVAQASPRKASSVGLRHVEASEVQKGMFRRAEALGHDTTYHIRVAWEVQGGLNLSRLDVALAEVVHRHELLRACFRPQGEQLLLRLHPVGDYALWCEALTENQVPDFLARLSEPFDLRTPSLLRCGVATLGPDRHVLALCAHHLIIDGMSLELLVDEVLTVYEGGVLPPLSAQYSAYLAWEREHRRSEKWEVDRQFWHAQLEGNRPRTEMPADPEANAADALSDANALDLPASASDRKARAGTYAFSLSEPAPLRAFARAQGATCSSLLNTIFQVFLLQQTGQTALCFGSPTSGRPAAGYQDVIGLFIGVIVWRLNLDPRQSFAQILAHTCQRMPELLDAQHYPFQALAQTFDPMPGRMPIFDVGFSYEASHGRGVLERAGLTLTPRPFAPRSVLMNVVLECADNGQTFALKFVYNADRYRAETVQRWAESFDQLAHSLVIHASTPLQNLLKLKTASEESLEGVTDA